MSTLAEKRRERLGRAKVREAMGNCEVCGRELDEESISASDGTNEPVRICLECAGEHEELTPQETAALSGEIEREEL